MHIDVLVPFFTLFRNEDLPLWLSIAIISIGFLFFVWYYFHFFRPVCTSLHTAARELDKIPGKNQFYAKFDGIDEIFNKPRLKQNWDEFKETFIFPGNLDEEKVIRHTIRPFKYFNFENLSQQYNISFYQAFPNILVGVGLLLTFCGLVSAIYLTGESIVSVHSSDVIAHSASLKNALDNLLHIAAFKFLTSIAGLITSIVLSILIRICNGIVRREYSKLNGSLERNLQYESQEHLICTQQTIALRQLDYLRRQSEQFQSFTTTFAQETAHKTALAINSVVKLHAEKLYARIDPAIELMGEAIGKATDQAMTQLVRDFSSALRFEAGQEMEKFFSSLLSAQQTLDELQKKVHDSIDCFSELFINALSEQKNSASAIFEQSLKRSEENAAKIEAEFVRLSQSLDEAMTEMAKKLEEASSRFHANLQEASVMLERTSDAFAKNIISSTEASCEQIQNTMANTVEAFQKSLHELKIK